MKSNGIGPIALALLIATALAGCDAFISAQQRIDRARADLAAGKWGSASIELRRAVGKEPKNTEAWLLLAQLSLDAADTGDAQGDLDHAMKAGGKGQELDELRVRTWLATGKPKALLDAASHRQLDIPEPDLSIAVARADNELQQPQRALALLEPILASHPALTEARLAAAEALAREGQLDAALKQADLAIANDRKSPLAPILKARLLASRGEFAAAEAAYDDALQRMSVSTPLPYRARALVGITEAQLAQGKVPAATTSESTLAKVVPNAPATRLLGARIKLIHKDAVGGISDLERLVADVPGYVEARLLLGAAQLSQGSLQQAQENLQQVVRETPDNLEARKLLASVRLKLKQPDEALRVLAPALGERTIDPQLLALFGTAAKRSNDPGAALAGLENAVRTHSGDTALRLNLAEAELVANRAKDALDVLEATQASGVTAARREGLLAMAVSAVKGPLAADAMLDKVVKSDPHDARVLDVAAAFFASHGNLDRARSLLEQASAAAPKDRAIQLSLARLDLAAGRAPAAVALLRGLVQSDPNNVAERIALADALTRERSFGEAVQVLQAVDRPHEQPQVPLALAGVYLASGNLKEANAALDRASALDPQNAAIESDAGALLMQANHYDAALARFRKAAALAPNNAQYWLDAGKAQLALNQPLAAQDSFEKALRIEPQWLPAVTGLTLIDLRAKNYGSALARVKQYLADHPGDPDGLSLEGEADAAAGKLADAATALSEAQRRRPEAAVAVRLYQVRAAEHVPDPQEPLEKWLALRPSDVMARTVLGNYYLAHRSLHKAASTFEAILRQSPSDVMAINNLAWTYNELHDPRAIATAEHAQALAPNTPSVLDTLAWILAQHQQVERALPLIAKAAKSGGNDPEIEYHYAYILDRAGHSAEAREVLTKLLTRKQPFDSRQSAEQLLTKLKG